MDDRYATPDPAAPDAAAPDGSANLGALYERFAPMLAALAARAAGELRWELDRYAGPRRGEFLRRLSGICGGGDPVLLESAP